MAEMVRAVAKRAGKTGRAAMPPHGGANGWAAGPEIVDETILTYLIIKLLVCRISDL